jgi:putative peptidoglycan lipid II flippase
MHSTVSLVMPSRTVRAGGLAGGLVGARVGAHGTAGEVALGVGVGVLAVLVWALVARFTAPTDVRALTGTLRRVVRR